MKRRPFYGWWVVLTGFIDQFTAAGFGVYAFSVLVKPMSDDADLGWSSTQLVWGITIGIVVATSTGPLFGIFLDKRHGPRLLMLVFALMGALGLILTSRVEHLWQYYLFFGVVSAFFLHTTIFLVVPTVVSKWFIRKRGRALIFSTMGRPASGLLMLPLTQVLMSAVGWRTTWLILGIAIVAIIIPLNALFLHRRPEDRGLLPDGDPEPIRLPNSAEPIELSWTLGLALRTRAFWMVLLATNLSGSGIIGVLVNQVAYLKEFYSDGWAVGGATLVTASSLFGRFGWLLVADRLNPRYSAAISFLLSASGMLFFLYADNVVMMVLWGLSFGVGIGGMDPMTSLLWARFFGRRFIGSIRGFVTMTNMVSIAGSPLLVAAIFEATGTYRPAFLILLAAFLASAVFILVSRPPRRPSRV